jgi:hypothetical protein
VDSKGFTAEEVRTWLEAVRADLRTVEDKMRPLLDEQSRLEAREALLHDLLGSFELPAGSKGLAVSQILPSPAGSVGQYVVERAVEILREAGKPLHINDLHAQFLARDYTIPGAGTPANLIVHLRKAPEIASPQRGMYGLTEDIGFVRPRRTKKRATTRRRRKG